MERIESYSDYREFLRDAYLDRKEHMPCFSYRYFCIKAGIKSPTLFKEVVEGKRNLTKNTIEAFAKGLALTESDTRYFSALVHFNQSEIPSEKMQYLEQMRILSRKVKQEAVPIDQYEYYSKWYLPVLRELACILDWKDDYRLLARAIVPPIKKSEVRESIEFLLSKGFLKKEPDGRYKQTKPAITSGSEVTWMSVRSFNEKMARRGVEAIHEFQPSERDIRTVVVGVSEGTYKLIKEEIREFISRIVRIVDNDKDSDRVYNLGVQLFPLSKTVSKEDYENAADE